MTATIISKSIGRYGVYHLDGQWYQPTIEGTGIGKLIDYDKNSSPSCKVVIDGKTFALFAYEITSVCPPSKLISLICG